MKKVKCQCGWKGGTADDFEGRIICPVCFKEIKIEKIETDKKPHKKLIKGGED